MPYSSSPFLDTWKYFPAALKLDGTTWLTLTNWLKVEMRCVHVCVLNRFSCVQLFATLWTVACQDPLSMEFSRQEYWNGLPFPPPGDLSDPGIHRQLPLLYSHVPGNVSTPAGWRWTASSWGSEVSCPQGTQANSKRVLKPRRFWWLPLPTVSASHTPTKAEFLSSNSDRPL